MSLYNMINGVSPVAFYILPVLGKHPDEYARFRDAFMGDPERADTKDKLIVYTRLGGGNRECYENDIEDIREMDGFLFDYDDDFDCTYANFVFDIPKKWAADVALIVGNKTAEVSDAYVDLVTGTYPKIADKLRAAMRPHPLKEENS